MSFGVFIVVEDRAEKRKHFFIFQVINSYYLGITRIMWKTLQMTKLQKQYWQFWPFWRRTETTVHGGIVWGGVINFLGNNPLIWACCDPYILIILYKVLSKHPSTPIWDPPYYSALKSNTVNLAIRNIFIISQNIPQIKA